MTPVIKDDGMKVSAEVTVVSVDLDNDKVPSLEIYIGARADKVEGADEVLSQIVKINLPEWVTKIIAGQLTPKV